MLRPLRMLSGRSVDDGFYLLFRIAVQLHLLIKQVNVAAAHRQHKIAGLPMGTQVLFSIVKGGRMA